MPTSLTQSVTVKFIEILNRPNTPGCIYQLFFKNIDPTHTISFRLPTMIYVGFTTAFSNNVQMDYPSNTTLTLSATQSLDESTNPATIIYNSAMYATATMLCDGTNYYLSFTGPYNP
jgi:hypothetical protein